MIRRTVAKNVSEQQALDACSPERQVAGSADSVRLSGGAPRMARGTRQVRKSREPGGRTGCQSGNKRKRVAANATTLVLQNWCRGRDSNPHSYCHYPLKIACLPVPPPRRRDALYAKPRRLASLFLQSIFSLKRCFSPASGRTALRRRLACYLFQRRNVLKKTAGPERGKACESRALRIHLLLTLGDCL